MTYYKLHLTLIISLTTFNVFPSAASAASAKNTQTKTKVDAVEKSAADTKAAVPAAPTPKKTTLRINTELAREIAATYNPDNSPSIDSLNALLKSGEALSAAYAQTRAAINEHPNKEEQEILQFLINAHRNGPVQIAAQNIDEVELAVGEHYKECAEAASAELKRKFENPKLKEEADSKFKLIIEQSDITQKTTTLLNNFHAFKKGASKQAQEAVTKVLAGKTTNGALFDRLKPLRPLIGLLH